MGAVRLLLFLKTTPLEKLHELEGVYISLPYDSCNSWFCIRNRWLARILLSKLGDDMDKWKELSVGRKRFWVAVGVIVAIAVVGWVTGWWSSPEVV